MGQMQRASFTVVPPIRALIATGAALLLPAVVTAQQDTSFKTGTAGSAARADSAQPKLATAEACKQVNVVDSLSRVLVASGAVKVDTVKKTATSLSTTSRDVKFDSASQAIRKQLSDTWKDIFTNRKKLVCGNRTYATSP